MSFTAGDTTCPINRGCLEAAAGLARRSPANEIAATTVADRPVMLPPGMSRVALGRIAMDVPCTFTDLRRATCFVCNELAPPLGSGARLLVHWMTDLTIGRQLRA